ncbi:phospholipase/carboxylesterase/thioesterase [Purpureocillium lavendulum]|uniref:Phospholipase/carboxylesterase/thioesterase n=1 Tax=Purpureocillium lavendulum TaxID=1247861 RepID=A0AB34FZ35_9HYPO|nr:phospholipase/carboxylesterase/thioesterase [Purpureocillium lavendulum]
MAMPLCGRDPHFSDSSSPSPGQPLNPPHIVKPSARHTHTVILLHDVASNGRMFSHDLFTTGKTAAGKTLDSVFPSVRWVFPTAPRRPCHAVEHARIAAWFDVVNLKDPSLRQDTQRRGLCTSAREIFAILRWELMLVAPEKLVLGGMGQGCAMALAILLSLGHKIGGVIGMSGFLPFQFELEMNTADDSSSESESQTSVRSGARSARGSNSSTISHDPAVKAHIFQRSLLQLTSADHPTKDQTSYGTPVLLGHGSLDDVLGFAFGEQAAHALETAEYNVEFKRYDDHGHGYKVPEQIDDIVEFMRRRVGIEPRAEDD